ncbi:MAG: hypothetical protein QOF70_5140 [Acetobacteraceae bacterium]|jgi:protein-S-isoprenylcysteine O-methyltransferase Ste14|nr:hypothetical protein [Acetobacteraceae bacterium]
MGETIDRANVVIRPPVAWALAFGAGLAFDWLYPLRFVPTPVPRIWIGSGLFAAGFALAIWAIVTFRTAGTRIDTTGSTTAIVTNGPYSATRNPIYLGMFLGQFGPAIGFDDLWMLAALVPFYLVIRYGVVAREEAYLHRKFGNAYLDYRSCVRRGL